MLVTFEGPEGGGKTTLMRALAHRLEVEGHTVLLTREPGDGPVGAEIRQILLHGENIDPMAELFLFLADRAQHVAGVIRPAIDQGKIVLCDRYADSTVVYQGYARGLDLGLLRQLNSTATQGLTPDLTLLLDLEPTVGLGRIAAKDRLDQEPIDFHIKVRNGFLAEASLHPGRWRVLDAAVPPQQVLEAALDALQELLSAHRP